MNTSATLSTLQAGPTASRPTYRLVQVLRATAAIMVVLHHEVEGIWQRFHTTTLGSDWVNGRAGVDIFFVISGFVMTISSRPLERTGHPARTFLARRLERVVPLYWLMITAKVLLAHVARFPMVNGARTVSNVLCSYLFIPCVLHGSVIDPVLVVGWTLNFEMLFYVLFAVALALRVRALKLLTPVFIVVLILSAVWRNEPAVLHWYGQTLLLEFLFGMLLAQWVHRLKRVPAAVALGGATVGIAVLLFWAAPNFSWWRGLGWGLPSLLLVGSCIALEEPAGRRTPPWLLELGDASYSIYLVHGFVIPVCLVLLAGKGLHLVEGKIATLIILLVFSVAAGDLLYRFVERPMVERFKNRRRTAVPANA